MPATASAPSDDALALPWPLALIGRLSWPLARTELGPLAGRLALGSLVLAALVLVAFSAGAPSILVSHSREVYPGWEAGPLHPIFSEVSVSASAVRDGFSLLVVALLVPYAIVLMAVRRLSLRAIVACIVALHVIFLLGPPIGSNDVFTYLGYSRLGGLHGFNPYNHVIAQEVFDPAYLFAGWHHLSSPYGPVFTALTYPLAWVPLSVAFWVMKLAMTLSSLGLLALIYKGAGILRRDQRYVLAFVALNPIYFVFALGGFHNDFLMLVPALGAVLLVLSGRDRSSGAALVGSIAIKFTMGLLLPFLVMAVRPARRRWRLISGVALAATGAVAFSIALFGASLPNLQDQASYLTEFSVPNVVGDIIGAGGGAPWVLHLADAALVVTVLYLLLVSRGDWISRTGWAFFALILSLAWLQPWYLLWLAPLAALGESVKLRRATIVLTVFLLITAVPFTYTFLAKHGLNPLGGAAGKASQARVIKLLK
jgi:Glycosyltransferase family 87